MAINFEEIPSEIDVPLEVLPQTRTVLEELNARQYLLNERTIKCADIKPFYTKANKTQHRYSYKYLCICPRYNPKYDCKHSGNIIIDRDVLTPEEHTVHLATPKANFAAPRKMPRYILKKTIVANCTPRIIRLAKPDRKHVIRTLNIFGNIISKQRKNSLKKLLEKSKNVEYTSIMNAVELLREEKRLNRVAARKEKLCCQKLMRKILYKQRRQIKKIVWILFEEMKEFLLNDRFVMDENSPLGMVILEALREFTDKEFPITNNLREYQKTLAFNLAVWINKFISSLNIHVAEIGPQQQQQQQHSPMTEIAKEEPTQELTTYLPVGDYISHSSDSDAVYCDVENEDSNISNSVRSERTLAANTPTDAV